MTHDDANTSFPAYTRARYARIDAHNSDDPSLSVIRHPGVPPDRDALERARVALREATLAVERYDPLVTVKAAAFDWGVVENTALKRARRGLGEKRGGRWYIRQSVVDAAK